MSASNCVSENSTAAKSIIRKVIKQVSNTIDARCENYANVHVASDLGTVTYMWLVSVTARPLEFGIVTNNN